MGLSGSKNIKILGECFETDKEYFPSFAGILVFSLLPYIISAILSLILVNVFLKNKIINWLTILLALVPVYTFTLHPFLHKFFVSAKKIDCPVPDPKCDKKYDEFITGKTNTYTCDDRTKVFI